MATTAVKELSPDLKQMYSEELGIDLESGDDVELFKWLLASVLYGKRISHEIAKRTYQEFEKADVLTPQSIHDTGWDGLVKLLDAGGYARYDYSTATMLLDISFKLMEEYESSLNALHKAASDPADLEHCLIDLKGVGPVTANIFLRELRTVWSKADPEPGKQAKQAAKELDIDFDGMNRRTKAFQRLEAGLVRYSLQR